MKLIKRAQLLIVEKKLRFFFLFIFFFSLVILLHFQLYIKNDILNMMNGVQFNLIWWFMGQFRLLFSSQTLCIQKPHIWNEIRTQYYESKYKCEILVEFHFINKIAFSGLATYTHIYVPEATHSLKENITGELTEWKKNPQFLFAMDERRTIKKKIFQN